MASVIPPISALLTGHDTPLQILRRINAPLAKGERRNPTHQ